MGDFLQGEFLRFCQPANPSHGLAIGHPDSSKQAGLFPCRSARLAIGHDMGGIVLIVRKNGPNRPVGNSGIGKIRGWDGAGFAEAGYYSHVPRVFAHPIPLPGCQGRCPSPRTMDIFSKTCRFRNSAERDEISLFAFIHDDLANAFYGYLSPLCRYDPVVCKVPIMPMSNLVKILHDLFF